LISLSFFRNQSEVATLISFDEPEIQNPPPDLLQFNNTPQKPAAKSTSQSSQNSTTFNIFGDSKMDEEQQLPRTTSDNSDSSSNELKEKISKLQESISRYEAEISTYKTEKKELHMKWEKIKSDLDFKTNKCDKMQNEINKVLYLLLCYDNCVKTVDYIFIREETFVEFASSAHFSEIKYYSQKLPTVSIVTNSAKIPQQI